MSPQEKRKSRRIRIGQPLKIRASDPKDAQIVETNTTKNVSRDGIYFVSEVAAYHEGMRIYVTVPHHTPRDLKDREYLGQITRIEKLPDGKWGVAVQFLLEVDTH